MSKLVVQNTRLYILLGDVDIEGVRTRLFSPRLSPRATSPKAVSPSTHPLELAHVHRPPGGGDTICKRWNIQNILEFNL